MSDARERRAAENESVFRRINERVEQLSPDGDELPVVCECAAPECVERLSGVTVGEYEAVRRHADRFFVAPGHERPELETVIESRPGYLIVAKRGVAGETAQEADPRSA